MTRYHSSVGDEIKERVLCHRCKKKDVIIYVSPGATVRVLCFKCKYRSGGNPKSNASAVKDEAYLLLGRLAGQIFSQHGVGPVKKFSPGSREFTQAEEEFWTNRKEKKRNEYHYNTFGK